MRVSVFGLGYVGCVTAAFGGGGIGPGCAGRARRYCGTGEQTGRKLGVPTGPEIRHPAGCLATPLGGML